MSIDILSHKFQVTKVPFESATDTLLNIRKRKERVIYSAQTTPTNVNLAFVESREVNSDDNLFISDHSTTLTANRINNTDPVIFSAASFTIEVNTFLLTDEFSVETATHPETPLFYKHLISLDRYDPASDSIVSLEILDSDFKVVPDITQLLVKTSSHDGSDYGTVFNNLQNTFNSDLESYEAFYIRYSIRKSGVTRTFVDILNNQPVYREAGFADLDGSNNILPDRKVYIIEESSGEYLITLTTNQQYAVIQTLKSRLQVERPSRKDSNDDWFVSITNGQFFAEEFNGSSVVRYAIPEFTAQLFEPYFPYKTITREEVSPLGGTLYKTANDNISIDQTQDFNVVVELLDENNEVEDSFTTDPLLSETGVGIRSVDQLNGFIDLFVKPKTGLTVKASYVYEEKQYQFTEVDFNPANNIDVAEEMIVVYVVPQSASRDRTLFYLRVDSLGEIVFSSEAEYADDHGITIASRIADPLGFFYNKKTLNQDSFINLYTVETALTSGAEYLANPGFLVLAEIYVGEAISNRDVGLVDIRRRGGGIINLNRKQIIADNFESLWNWDVGSWDGQPYPGTATCMVEVPCEVLTNHGGNLEDLEIRPIVQEHIALGVYPIIRTYGADPIVSVSGIRDTEVDLAWTDFGPEVTYNIYTATTEDGPFTLLTTSGVADNMYTVDGLTAGTKYWFFVTGVKDGHECTDADDVFILNLQTR